MVLHQVRHHRLGQVRVGPGEERAEVLRVGHQLADRPVLLGPIAGGLADRVVHHHADVLAPQRQERALRVRPVDGADRLRHRDRVGVERPRRGLELRVAPAQGRVGGGRGQVDVLAKREVERGAQRGRRRLGGAREPVGELLHDRARQWICHHLHVAGAHAERGEGAVLVTGGLGVDHRLEGEHVVLHEVRHRRLGQVRVGSRQERAEVLRVGHQVAHRFLLLGAVLGGGADRIVHHHADVLAPQRQERLLGVRPVDRADRLGHVDRVRVQRGGGRLELGLAPAQGRVGRGGRQVDVLAQQGVEPDAQARGRSGRGRRVEPRGPHLARARHAHRGQGEAADQSLQPRPPLQWVSHDRLLLVCSRSHFTRISPRMDWCRLQK